MRVNRSPLCTLLLSLKGTGGTEILPSGYFCQYVQTWVQFVHVVGKRLFRRWQIMKIFGIEFLSLFYFFVEVRLNVLFTLLVVLRLRHRFFRSRFLLFFECFTNANEFLLYHEWYIRRHNLSTCPRLIKYRWFFSRCIIFSFLIRFLTKPWLSFIPWLWKLTSALWESFRYLALVRNLMDLDVSEPGAATIDSKVATNEIIKMIVFICSTYYTDIIINIMIKITMITQIFWIRRRTDFVCIDAGKIVLVVITSTFKGVQHAEIHIMNVTTHARSKHTEFRQTTLEIICSIYQSLLYIECSLN